MEPFTIRTYSTATGDIMGIAREMCAARSDAHRHCALVLGTDMADADDNLIIWDDDCDLTIAYVEVA